MSRYPRKARCLALPLLALSLVVASGCAGPGPKHESDPLEGFNRGMYTFNKTVDETLVKPIATGYKNVTPTPVNKGITNFFGNINEVVVIINGLLQGKLRDSASDVGRLVTNSTFGMLGFIDVASSLGMPKHDEDFGQTLGRWGLGDGPYLVLPIFGPHTFRSTGGLIVDSLLFDPILLIDDESVRYTAAGVKYLDIRSDLLSATSIVDEAALDEYSFVRDAYLQRRNYLLYDGNPPEQELEDDELEDQ